MSDRISESVVDRTNFDDDVDDHQQCQHHNHNHRHGCNTTKDEVSDRNTVSSSLKQTANHNMHADNNNHQSDGGADTNCDGNKLNDCCPSKAESIPLRGPSDQGHQSKSCDHGGHSHDHGGHSHDHGGHSHEHGEHSNEHEGHSHDHGGHSHTVVHNEPGQIVATSCCADNKRGNGHKKHEGNDDKISGAHSHCAAGGHCCDNEPDQKRNEDANANDVHHHDHSKESCCHSEHKEDEGEDEGNSFPMCVAVIQENKTDVVIYDAQGISKTFKYDGTNDAKYAVDLCFATHGVDHSIESLLSPCFDKDGIHGAPAELCFCGIDTPHLHAHMKDPSICNADSISLEILASKVLYPVSQTEVLKINISDSMPKVCNSLEIMNQILEHKFCVKIAKKTRLNQVQHDDHVDYLVHNNVTGELHLEHPCSTCGQNDVHGKFRSVEKRALKSYGAGEGILLQFFEVESKPFKVLEFAQSIFQVQSDRVNAVDQIRENWHSPSRYVKRSPGLDIGSPQKYVRSTLVCSQICCSSEIPVINKILGKVNGVQKLTVNVPLKIVNVDHDPSKVTAWQLIEALNEQSMGAAVQRDGAASETNMTNMSASENNSGRSQFFVQGICCASEVPIIKKILLPVPGVKSVSINTTTKVVYVDHEPSVTTAEVISITLTQQGFKSEILRDANSSDTVLSNMMLVRSILSFEKYGQDSKLIMESTIKCLDALIARKFLEEFSLNKMNRTVQVVHNPFVRSAGSIVDELLEATNFRFAILRDGSDPKLWNFTDSLPKDEPVVEEENEKFIYPKANVIASGILWIISMISHVGDKWDYLKYVALLSISFGIPPIALKTFRTLRRFQFDTNCLMFFASVGAMALQDFTEAAAVVFLFALSEWLEVRATTRARRALSAILDLRPEKANLVHPFTKELIVVPASIVPVGSKVSIRVGDKIPCDGIVKDGFSTVDESSLTGESRPVRKGPGESVSGGTVNSGKSPLLVETTSTSENSAVAKLIRLVEEAEANRSQTERLVDEFAKVYTPVVVLAAILMCSIPWAFGREIGREWTNNGLVLLVIACPCALIISTPVAYVAGIAAAAQKGVLIKGGAYLESLAQVKSICFDKTGTLTNGSFSLLHLNTFSASLSRVEVVQYLAAMEECASHPVAQAILTASKNEGVSVPNSFTVESHEIINGEGLSGVVNGLLVHVGSERLFERLGTLSTLAECDRQNLTNWKASGGTVGLMSIDGHGIVCAFNASDSIRTEAKKVLQSLKRRGISLTMLTGDNRNAANAIGRQLGFVKDEIKAELKPDDKLQYIKDACSGMHGNSSETSYLLRPTQQDKLRPATSACCNLFASKHLVLFCGDGVNDAPALAAADVGVAMGAGAALAMDSADVTLLDSNLEKIEYCIVLGRRVTAKITQNVVFSLIIKAIVLILALSGWTTLWAAIASDVGSMLVVTLNAMTLLPAGSRSHKEDGLSNVDVETQPANQSRID